MTNAEVQSIIEKQRAYFAAGATLPVAARRRALKKLYDNIVRMEDEILDALHADLGKSRTEAYMCEVGLTLSEVTHMRRKVGCYARNRRVSTPMAQAVAHSYVMPCPYGQVLVMSPWNYPFLLTIEPLVDAIAAGNTVVVKPSAYSPATGQVIRKLLEETFEPQFVTVVLGGRAENQCLLEADFNYIFFTGSKGVGRHVLACAAPRLIPCTLELGGKSPCIVTSKADVRLAARRIVFGKFINCGQTCVAPDYIYCEESVKPALVEALKAEIELQYGKSPLQNESYGKIINQKHFERICGLIAPEKVVCGGGSDAASLKIEPTVMDGVTWEDVVMGEEIFGPVLPVLTYQKLEDVAAKVNSMETPLALYIFSGDKREIRFVTSRVQYGGGCVNDTIVHLATSSMGFGGAGESGMGAYHGKVGFDTFTHYKSMMDKKVFLDMPLRYQPYRKLYDKIIRFFLK